MEIHELDSRHEDRYWRWLARASLWSAALIVVILRAPPLLANELQGADGIWSVIALLGLATFVFAFLAGSHLRHDPLEKAVVTMGVTALVAAALVTQVAPNVQHAYLEAFRPAVAASTHPFGPWTFEGLTTLWAHLTVSPPAELRISTDTPLQWPRAYVVWRITLPAWLFGATLLSALAGRWAAMSIYRPGSSGPGRHALFGATWAAQVSATVFLLEWTESLSKAGSPAETIAYAGFGGAALVALPAIAWGVRSRRVRADGAVAERGESAQRPGLRAVYEATYDVPGLRIEEGDAVVVRPSHPVNPLVVSHRIDRSRLPLALEHLDRFNLVSLDDPSSADDQEEANRLPPPRPARGRRGHLRPI